ncbi:MFS-type transporter SLC18B1-like [Ptychodera flava]|uniref:MFS-type transporter SLC18B1-like n=1 Tax=Ptychodera flava TaxID=63121 RepID=UPI00396A94E8
MADTSRTVSHYGTLERKFSQSLERDPLSNPSSKHETSSTKYTREQKLILFSISLANFCSFASFSILAPFFPGEASDMGASDTMIGFIFGWFALVMFVSSPIFGKFLPHIGAKFVYVAGEGVCGACSIIFGFLNKLDKGTEFVVYCFLVRGVQALGAAASATASYAIIAKFFPDNVSTVFGLSEIFTGLGYMIGPPLGGVLYQTGGYTLPFVLLGGITLLACFCIACTLPHETGNSSQESGSILRLLLMPATWLTLLCVLTQSIAFSFLDPTLANHLEQFNLNTTEVGFMFLIYSATYTLSAYFWGWLADKKDICKLLMIIGNIGCGAAFLYIGPCPLFNIEQNLPVVVFSLAFFGLSCGCAFIPSFQDLISTAIWYGMPDDLMTYGVVSGVYSGLFSLGSFIGPTAGAALVEKHGFDWTTSVFSSMYFGLAFLFVVACLFEYRCGRGRAQSIQTPKEDENINVFEEDREAIESIFKADRVI